MRIGAQHLAGAFRAFRGSIDEIRWWQGVRDPDAVWETLSERLSGAEASLKGQCLLMYAHVGKRCSERLSGAEASLKGQCVIILVHMRAYTGMCICVVGRYMWMCMLGMCVYAYVGICTCIFSCVCGVCACTLVQAYVCIRVGM